MAKIKSEDLRLNIIVNGDTARKEILETERRLKDATQAYKALVKESKTSKVNKQDIKQAAAEVEKYKQKLEQAQSRMKLTDMTMSELSSRSRQLRSALSKAVPGTENWVRLNSELQSVKARLTELNNSAQKVGASMGALGRTSIVFAAVTIAGRSIENTLRKATDAFLEFNEAQVDAMKTTGLNKAQIDSLSESLRAMDTKTPVNELLSLVRAGGKLGISGEEDLLGFARAADQINVALSKDLGGDAEAAITAIGKMTDIFGLTDEYGIEKAMLKVGSAINSLGMASTANEGYIVDFSKRLAGIAPNANISIDKVLGLAATLDQFGQSAETSATAIGQVFVAMFKKTETFAGIAGKSVEEFTSLLNNDVNAAFLSVLEGMQQGEGGLASVTAAMEEMHLNGQRAVTVLGTLSKNTETLKLQQEEAVKAFNEGVSVTNEFNLKNTSLTAQLQKQRNALLNTTVAIGQQLQPALNSLMSGANSGLTIVSKAVALAMKYRVVLAALTAAMVTHSAVTKLLTARQKLHSQSVAETTVQLQGATATTALLSAAKLVLAGNFKAATVACKAFTKALMANPIGLIAAGIAAAITGLISLIKWMNKAAAENKKLLEEQNKAFNTALREVDNETKAFEALKEAILGAAEGSRERAAAIDEMNERFGSYIGNLIAESDSNEKIAASLAAVNNELRTKMLLERKAQAAEEARAILDEAIDSASNKAAAVYRNRSFNANLSSVAYAPEIHDFTGQQAGMIDSAIFRYLDSVISGSDSSNAREEFKQAVDEAYASVFSEGETRKPVTDSAINAILKPLDSAIGAYEYRIERINSMYETVLPNSSGAGSVNSNLGSTEEGDLAYDEIGASTIDSAPSETVTDTLSARLNALEDYYAERKALAEAGHTAELAEAEAAGNDLTVLQARQANELLDIERERLEALQALYEEQSTESGGDSALSRKIAENQAKMAELERKYQANIRKIRSTEQKAALAEQDQLLKDSQKLYEYNTAIEKDRHSAALAAAEGNNALIEEEQQRHAEAMLSIDTGWLEQQQAILEKILGGEEMSLADLMPKTGEANDGLNEYREKLVSVITKIRELEGGGEVDSYGRTGVSVLGLDTSEWNTLFDGIVAGADAATLAVRGLQGAFDEAFSLMGKLTELQSAKEQKALEVYKKANEKREESLDARLDAGLMSQEQYDAEVEEMEEELEAYEEELSLKQAKREKAQSIAQSLINTALAVTKTIATLGIPAGIAPAAIAAAMGAAETAIIAATPITTGYAEGGYVAVKDQEGKTYKAKLNPERRGYVSEPTVLVGEKGGEYVIPNEGLSNPSLQPFLASIEAARRAGTLKSLSFDAVYPATAMMARASGGYTAAQSTPVAMGLSQAAEGAGNKEMISAMRSFAKAIQQPITANVSMLGRNGIAETQEKYNRAKNRGKL